MPLISTSSTPARPVESGHENRTCRSAQPSAAAGSAIVSTRHSSVPPLDPDAVTGSHDGESVLATLKVLGGLSEPLSQSRRA